MYVLTLGISMDGEGNAHEIGPDPVEGHIYLEPMEVGEDALRNGSVSPHSPRLERVS